MREMVGPCGLEQQTSTVSIQKAKLQMMRKNERN
jgi:hypothetical protein